MPENFCPDRFKPIDPIDQEANNINRFLQNGDRMAASARLHDDIQAMGPTKFMTMVGEVKALANLSGSMTNIEITTLNICGQDKVDVSLVTEGRDSVGRLVSAHDPIVRIDNNERYEFPQPVRFELPPPPTVPCEPPRPIPCEPPPPVLCEPPPHMRTPPPWEPPPRFPYPIEQPCPPQRGSGGLKIDIDLDFFLGRKTNDHNNRNQDHRYEPNRYEPNRYEPNRYDPTRYDPRRYDAREGHANNNRGNENVIVNNYNTVNVRGGDSNSNSNSHSDNNSQKPDPHKRVEHHR